MTQMPFPELDPIPLPAPVWFFKTLHIATLSLHFVAVHLLVGGLILATVWNFLGRNKPSSVHAEASGAIAKRLPIVMTYLINLGVPPLLFSQVLYGRALYTSSVLIGAYWISVIFLLMAGYYLLYKVSQRAEEGRSWWWLGILSFVLISYIARIYTANMTLMIRPEVWLDLYRSSSHGAVMPMGDPTVLPRWLFMMIGSVGVAGVAVALTGTASKLSGEVKTFMRRWGGGVAAVFIAAQVAIGYWVWRVQPTVVKDGIFASPLYRYGLFAWLSISAVVAVGAALVAVKAQSHSSLLPALSSVMAALATAAVVMIRDGIRDLTLAANGFNVWEQPVVSNWSVVILFLVLFAAGLAAIGWMMKVALQTKGAKQSHA
jgi:hypothetical protein